MPENVRFLMSDVYTVDDDLMRWSDDLVDNACYRARPLGVRFDA